MHLECNQGMMSITDYTTEFLRLFEWKRIGESDGQKAACYICGLKPRIQDKIELQTVWTVTEASSLALKAELLEYPSIVQTRTDDLNSPMKVRPSH